MSSTALRAFGPWVISLVGILIGMALIVTTPPARVPVGFRVEDGLSYLLLPLTSITIGAIVGGTIGITYALISDDDKVFTPPVEMILYGGGGFAIGALSGLGIYTVTHRVY